MRTIDPDQINLLQGAHEPPADDCGNPEACFWEYYNWLLDGPLTDSRPPGVSPVLHYYAMRLNDRLPDDKRQALKEFLPGPDGTSPLDGTEGDGHDARRIHMLADWTVRTAAPAWLDHAGFTDQASALRALQPIVDEATAQLGRDAVRKAREVTWAARSAAWDKLRARLKEIYAAAATATATATDATATDATATAADATATAADAAAATATDATDATATAATDAAAAAAATTATATDAAAAGAAAAAAAAAATAATDATDATATAATAATATATATAAGGTRAYIWGETYSHVYAEVYADVLERLRPKAEELREQAIGLLRAMIRPGTAQ